MREDARSVKSTGCEEFGRVNVAVTGLVVPNAKAGIFTFAFVALTTEKPCKPIVVFTMSTVTTPDPALIASNPARLPGKTSVTVSVGTQTPGGTGVGVGVGGTGVGVGVGGTGVGVGVGGIGVGVGVGGTGVGVGFGVGAGPPVHCALMRTALIREDARSVKSTGCPGTGIVNVAVTGS